MKSVVRFVVLMMAMELSYSFMPQSSMAQAKETSDIGPSGTMFGVQASTNFQQMLVGFKIQMNNFAVTPKFGFFIQSLKDQDGSVFNVGVGSSFDYYFNKGKKLRPYVGGDLLFYIPHVPGSTDLWVVISPHLGAEYWLSRSFSVGGNLGFQFGVGESFYTPNTIGLVDVKSDLSFGINGMLQVTYYF